MKLLRNFVGICYAGIIGIILGFLSWLFLFLVYMGIHLFWDSFILKQNSNLLILAVCLIGGLVVGLGEKYIGKYPKTMEGVLVEFKSTGTIEYKSLPKAIVKTFTVLWFGATVGPEAGLSGIIGGLSTIVGELLRYGFKRINHDVVKINSKLKGIFEIPLYGVENFVDKNKEEEKKTFKNMKILLYGVVGLFAIITIFILISLDEKISFITKFPKTILTEREVLFFIPLFIVGLVIVFYCSILDKFFEKIFVTIKKYKIALAILGGLLIGLLAIRIPFVLFSGEHSLKALLTESSSMGVGILLIIGMVKIISMKICVNTGWIGGPIFPIMFSAAAIGIAFAGIFNVGVPFAVAIIMATALSGILGNFKITFILIIWFFTINTWPFILIASFLAEKINKFVKVRRL